MSENLHDIDKLFRDAIEGQEEMPPPGVWNELDQKLDKRKVASIAGKYYKLKWVAAALFLVSIGMAMYVYRVNRIAAVVKNDKAPHRTAGGLRSPLPSGPPTVQHPPATTAQAPGTDAPTPPKKINDSLALLSATPPLTSPHNTATVSPSSVSSTGTKPVDPLPDGNKSKPAPVLGSDNSFHSSRKGYANNAGARATTHSNGLISRHPSGKEKEALALAEKQRASSAGQGKTMAQTIVEPQGNLDLLRYAEALPDIQRLQPGDPAANLPAFLVHNPLFDSLANGHSGAAAIHLTPSHVPRLTASVFFSPNLFSTHVTNNAFSPPPTPNFPNEDSKSIKDKETNGTSWSLGATLDLALNNHWSIGTGLVLSTRVTYIRPSPIYGNRDQYGAVKYQFNCSSGYSIIELKGGQSGGGPSGNPAGRDTAKSFSSMSRLQYVAVPVIMKYHFGQGRLQFNTGLGLQTNILANRKLETYITKGSRVEFATTSGIQGLRSVYLSGIFSASASYSLNQTVSLTVTPNAQIGFMSINQFAPVKSYINFYGLAAGFSIKL